MAKKTATTLHYYQNNVKSSKPPLIILHGLFGSGANFQSILKEVDYPTIAFDLRNHGHSFHHENMEYAQMAGDVTLSLSELKIKKCLLLGHSMGGKVALTIAQKSSALLEKLIIEDIAPLSYPNNGDYFLNLIEELKLLDLQKLTQKLEAFDFLKDKIELRTLQFLLTNLKFDDKRGFYWQVNLDAIKNSMQIITGFSKNPQKIIDTKTFWIAGAKSNYLSKKIYEDIKKTYPNSKYFELNAGHWVHYEQKPAFVKLVVDIINS